MEDIKLEDDSYIYELIETRKKESSLVERLIQERMYLAKTIRIDPLTGLYNRRILPKVRDVGTVVMCDIDNFKTINDTYGHEVGDEVIKSVAALILDSVRIGDVAIRFGGDEFLMIFSNNLSKEIVENRLNGIRDKAREVIELPLHTITLSIGVAFNDDNEELNTLIENADKALYRSKENGKDKISYYGETNVLKKC